MKILWEKDDIQAGLYVIRNISPNGSKDYNFAATVVFKIGYDNTNSEKQYGRMNCLTDG